MVWWKFLVLFNSVLNYRFVLLKFFFKDLIDLLCFFYFLRLFFVWYSFSFPSILKLLFVLIIIFWYFHPFLVWPWPKIELFCLEYFLFMNHCIFQRIFNDSIFILFCKLFVVDLNIFSNVPQKALKLFFIKNRKLSYLILLLNLFVDLFFQLKIFNRNYLLFLETFFKPKRAHNFTLWTSFFDSIKNIVQLISFSISDQYGYPRIQPLIQCSSHKFDILRVKVLGLPTINIPSQIDALSL